MQYIDMQQQTISTWKTTKKDKEASFIMYWDVNNLYGRAMSQKLPVDGFKWKKNTSKFHKNFIKN